MCPGIWSCAEVAVMHSNVNVLLDGTYLSFTQISKTQPNLKPRNLQVYYRELNFNTNTTNFCSDDEGKYTSTSPPAPAIDNVLKLATQ
jgi:hypothetical protein